MNRFFASSVVAVALAGTGASTLAAKAAKAEEAQRAPVPKISLAQAIATAEQQGQGRATRAEYEQSKGAWIYDVEVLSGTKVLDIRIDPHKGTVLSSAEDKADNEEDGDDQD
jgi:uncharacterized membrane protein YkoI